MCRKLKSLSPELRKDIVKKHQLCYNCLQSGHLTLQSTSDRKCFECRNHTIRSHSHISSSATAWVRQLSEIRSNQCQLYKTEDSSASHSSNLPCPNFGGQRGALMMTYQIAAVTPNSHETRARALLDYASSIIRHRTFGTAIAVAICVDYLLRTQSCMLL